MSALTVALEIIKDYLIQHPPKYFSKVVSRLKPGLSRKQIDVISKDFPYALPEEIYELYQWHNGIDDFGDKGGWNYFISTTGGMFGFLPLEEALKQSQNRFNLKLKYNALRYKYEPNWLLIFDQASDRNAAGVVVVIEKQNTYIRSYDPEDFYYDIIHSSLTNMILDNAINKGDLSNKNFSGGDFKKLNLYCKNINNSNLENADFREANLVRTNFKGANIDNAKFQRALYDDFTILPQKIDKSELFYIGANADLSNLDLQRVYLTGKNLENTSFTGANLIYSRLGNACLRNADLSKANLERADLSNADLSQADLSGANLHGAKLNGTNLTNANLSNATWVYSWIVNDFNTPPIFNNTIMPDGSIKNW